MTRHARAPRISRPRLIVATAAAVVVLAGASSAVVLSARHHGAAFDAAAWSDNSSSSSRQPSAANPTVSASASGSPSGTSGSTAKAGQPPPARSTAGIWRPAPGTTWQWQIVDQIGPSLRNVQMYDVDLTDAVPVSTVVPVAGFGSATWPKGINAGIIGRLHATGKVAICYLDTGAWESYEPDHALFPGQPGWSGGASNDVIGNSTGWDNEYWLDIRAGRTGLFAPIQWARLDLAKSIGCDGIEPDENNPYGNNPGPAISLADEKAWYMEVARQAHARGLSVGMKNGVEVTDADTVAAFDWNLNEECFFYDECGVLDAFIRAGKAVFQTEYTDDWKSRGSSDPAKLAASNSFCPSARAHHFATMVKNQVPDDLFVTC